MMKGCFEVKDDINSKKHIYNIIHLIRSSRLVKRFSPIEANLNWKLDTVIYSEANNDYIPLNTKWMVKLDDPLLP